MISLHSVRVYPPGFPCFSREGYSMDLDLGLIRTNSDVLTNTQRRSYTNLPTIITSSITIPVNILYEFTAWLNGAVGLWVDLPLAHPFLTHGNKVEYVPARIIDFIFTNSYQAFGSVNASVTIQLSPTVFIDNSNPEEGGWVIAGRATSPSSEWMIAGRVNNPAIDWNIATVASPSEEP